MSTLQALVFSADFTKLTAPGAAVQMIATGILVNGTTQDVTASCTNWQSDNTTILSVTSGGMLTAQSTSGAATITTTCGGVSARGSCP